jgi:hypothetical protein
LPRHKNSFLFSFGLAENLRARAGRPWLTIDIDSGGRWAALAGYIPQYLIKLAHYLKAVQDNSIAL